MPWPLMMNYAANQTASVGRGSSPCLGQPFTRDTSTHGDKTMESLASARTEVTQGWENRKRMAG